MSTTEPLVGKRPRASHIFERQPENHYVEPLWCSARLLDILDLPARTSIWDPACGFGRVVRAATDRGHMALGTDIRPRWIDNPDGPHERGAFRVADFFSDEASAIVSEAIISNPPYDCAQAFAELALERATRLVALLLPTKWLNGAKRAAWRQTTPLHLVMPINPRPSMPPGHVIEAGQKPSGGTVDFSWFVWLHGYMGSPTIKDCLLAEGQGRRC